MNDLEAEHTAILFHWPDSARPDAGHILAGVLQGEALQRQLDVLLAEHVVPLSDKAVETEISVFWHLQMGAWHTVELRSTTEPLEGAGAAHPQSAPPDSAHPL